MVGLVFGVVISESMYHNFDRVAAFRFYLYYVNYLFLYYFYLLLQSINLKGVPGDDVIKTF
jgi:hypothetical protein